ncbi:serine protease grass [Drosophila biarmipes]|uniref:serine protease grass n=1 Tax=Drosophila biarmipes TaxID=125945 RepID=UPI0021CC61B2|nr:serine protease grass [Drosophila biarmipes]
MTMTVFKTAEIVASAILFLLIATEEGSAYLFEPNCGTANITYKIPGKADADIFLNPWMVLVIGEANCGGSLINSRFVLTAAHCLSSSPMKARFGDYDTEHSGEDCMPSGDCIPSAFAIDVDKKISHEDYDNFKADIALLRMRSTVKFSEHVRPICLLVDEQVGTISHFNITGWGQTKEGGKLSRILKTGTQSEVDSTKCAGRFKLFKTQVDSFHICAGSSNSSACGGDSGGPMSAVIAYQGTLRHTQFGIISFGLRSCRGLDVHTNVSYYMDWIVHATKTYSV